jgi:hypothetical protein
MTRCRECDLSVYRQRQLHDRLAGLEQIAHERNDWVLTAAVQTANICFWDPYERLSYFPALHGNARANANEAT